MLMSEINFSVWKYVFRRLLKYIYLITIITVAMLVLSGVCVCVWDWESEDLLDMCKSVPSGCMLCVCVMPRVDQLPFISLCMSLTCYNSSS